MLKITEPQQDLLDKLSKAFKEHMEAKQIGPTQLARDWDALAQPYRTITHVHVSRWAKGNHVPDVFFIDYLARAGDPLAIQLLKIMDDYYHPTAEAGP